MGGLESQSQGLVCIPANWVCSYSSWTDGNITSNYLELIVNPLLGIIIKFFDVVFRTHKNNSQDNIQQNHCNRLSSLKLPPILIAEFQMLKQQSYWLGKPSDVPVTKNANAGHCSGNMWCYKYFAISQDISKYFSGATVSIECLIDLEYKTPLVIVTFELRHLSVVFKFALISLVPTCWLKYDFFQVRTSHTLKKNSSRGQRRAYSQQACTLRGDVDCGGWRSTFFSQVSTTGCTLKAPVIAWKIIISTIEINVPKNLSYPRNWALIFIAALNYATWQGRPFCRHS